MNAFTLRQLEYLVAAAEGGSLRVAATRCNSSESSVSTAISVMEAAAGAQLLIRRRAHGVSPTATGNQVVEIARQMLRLADDLRAAVDAERGILSGRLAVGCLSTFSAQLLPLIAAHFADHFPQVELRLVEGSAPDLQQMLRSGEVDVAVLLAFHTEHAIHSTHLTPVHPRIMISRDHALAHEDSVSLLAMGSTPLIVLSRPASTGLLESFMEEAGIGPSPRWTFSNPETVRAMVERGFGYSVTIDGPPPLVRHDEGIVFKRIEEHIPSTSVVLARLQRARANARIHELRDFLEETLARGGVCADGEHPDASQRTPGV